MIVLLTISFVSLVPSQHSEKGKWHHSIIMKVVLTLLTPEKSPDTWGPQQPHFEDSCIRPWEFLGGASGKEPA